MAHFLFGYLFTYLQCDLALISDALGKHPDFSYVLSFLDPPWPSVDTLMHLMDICPVLFNLLLPASFF